MRIQLSIAQRANRLFLMNCRHSDRYTVLWKEGISVIWHHCKFGRENQMFV